MKKINQLKHLKKVWLNFLKHTQALSLDETSLSLLSERLAQKILSEEIKHDQFEVRMSQDEIHEILELSPMDKKDIEKAAKRLAQSDILG